MPSVRLAALLWFYNTRQLFLKSTLLQDLLSSWHFLTLSRAQNGITNSPAYRARKDQATEADGKQRKKRLLVPRAVK